MQLKCAAITSFLASGVPALLAVLLSEKEFLEERMLQFFYIYSVEILGSMEILSHRLDELLQ